MSRFNVIVKIVVTLTIILYYYNVKYYITYCDYIKLLLTFDNSAKVKYVVESFQGNSTEGLMDR